MNKILILVYVPVIEERYDIFIPINRRIGTIKKHIIKTISEFSDGTISENYKAYLHDKTTGIKYDENIYVKDSNIKNGSRLMLL